MIFWRETGARKIVRRYIEALNKRDIDQIGALFHADCRLVDSNGGWIEGRRNAIVATRKLIHLEPHFHLAVSSITRRGG